MITHDHQLIFVHIPKCAGRSICDIFHQRFDHYTAKYYELEFSQCWHQYKKFSIVRNPFDRLVSLYVYIKNHRRHSNENIGKNIHSFKDWVIGNISAFNGNFMALSAEGQRGTDGHIGSPFWFTSQWQRIISSHGTCELNQVFNLDNGTQEIEAFLSEVCNKKIVMPHVNVSEYDDYKSFYDNETYALVSEFAPVKEDLQKLNIKFL